MTSQTRERLINEATYLMRDRGYSAFSYADLSKIVGISKASIHHHFASKEILGEQVILTAYKETEESLSTFYKENSSCIKRIEAYSELFLESINSSKLPLCCALSAELTNLPDTVKEQASSYFNLQINWLIKVLKEGKEAHEFREDFEESQMALTILSLFEGATIVFRVLNNPELFSQCMVQIKTLLKSNS